jgi:hypothetical protein
MMLPPLLFLFGGNPPSPDVGVLRRQLQHFGSVASLLFSRSNLGDDGHPPSPESMWAVHSALKYGGNAASCSKVSDLWGL